MKIIVLEGSPNQHGSSNMLADNFIRGAEEAGHTVKVSMLPTRISIPASAVSTAVMKAHVCRKTT